MARNSFCCSARLTPELSVGYLWGESSKHISDQGPWPPYLAFMSNMTDFVSGAPLCLNFNNIFRYKIRYLPDYYLAIIFGSQIANKFYVCTKIKS